MYQFQSDHGAQDWFGPQPLLRSRTAFDPNPDDVSHTQGAYLRSEFSSAVCPRQSQYCAVQPTAMSWLQGAVTGDTMHGTLCVTAPYCSPQADPTELLMPQDFASTWANAACPQWQSPHQHRTSRTLHQPDPLAVHRLVKQGIHC